MLPPNDELAICFAHVAYRLGERFALRNAGMRAIEVRSFDDLSARIPEADVLVVSGLWRNELIERAAKLRFIQSIGAGTDQFQREGLRAHGIRLASAQGVNERAVAEQLVEHDEARMQDEDAREADPAQLAARQLVRIKIEMR